MPRRDIQSGGVARLRLGRAARRMPRRGDEERDRMSSVDELRAEIAVPVVLVDHLGFIIQTNAAFDAAFGWGGEIVGKTLTTIIPAHLHDAHNLGFARFLMTGRPTLLGRPLTLLAVAKDGREFQAEHTIVAERRDGGWVFAATIRPLGRTA